MSFDDGFILGMALGKKQSGGGDDDNDPDYAVWQELPEPESNQAVLLMYCTGTSGTDVKWHIEFGLSYITGMGWTVDWGDGTVDTYVIPEGNENNDYVGVMDVDHGYKSVGRYTVTCTVIDGTTNASIRFWDNSSTNTQKEGCGNNVVMAKIGADVDPRGYDGTMPFAHLPFLKYFKSYGDYPLPSYFFNFDYALKSVELAYPITEIKTGTFTSCISLEDIDLSAVTSIGSSAFVSCYSLKSVNAPLCTSIDSGAFSSCYSLETVNIPLCTSIVDYLFGTACYSLKTVNAPLCTSIGNYAFFSCYGLCDVTFADDCTYGTNSFTFCNGLYPHPDGSLV